MMPNIQPKRTRKSTGPPGQGEPTIKSHLSDVHRLQRERSPYKTVKLTPVTGPKRTLPARYANVRPSKQTKPPAYLFRYTKMSKSRRQNKQSAPITMAHPADPTSVFCLAAF